MSIRDKASSRTEENVREMHLIDARHRTKALESASLEQIDRFRTLFHTRGERQLDTHRKEGIQADVHREEDAHLKTQLANSLTSADALRHSALYDDMLRYRRLTSDSERSATTSTPGDVQQHVAVAQGDTSSQPMSAPHVDPQRFADLLARHVSQLAISGDTSTDSDGQVLLRLAEDTLPGTDLLLSRTRDGWQLRADVGSRSSFEAIRQAAPELSRRFAERNLGTLSIDPHLHET